MFWSCGEVEELDAGLVVAGQVVFFPVARLVVVHVVVEVAADDDGAELEDVLGAVGGSSRACNSEAVFDDESAGAPDHSGGDRPSLLFELAAAGDAAGLLGGSPPGGFQRPAAFGGRVACAP
jgi:hypothetical protein